MTSYYDDQKSSERPESFNPLMPGGNKKVTYT